MRRWLPLIAVVAVVGGGMLVEAGRGVSSGARRFEDWKLRPRVLAGGDAFEIVTVTDRASKRQTGEFDSEPGEDLAIVDFGGVQLLTPATLAERQRLDMAAETRTRWTASSRLARVG